MNKAVHLILSMPFEKLSTGASRFWGSPDLPLDVEYPTYEDVDGEVYPYTFVCQINLEQLHAFDPANPLPEKGLLLFFAKIDRYLGYFESDSVSGYISSPEDVKVLYFPDTGNMEEVVLLDEYDEPMTPNEFEISFASETAPLSNEHILFAAPDHREWETWDEPFEDWEILLQIDSFVGMDFDLNFMDCGVLDFLISPEDLKAGRFDNVRAIVLST